MRFLNNFLHGGLGPNIVLSLLSILQVAIFDSRHCALLSRGCTLSCSPLGVGVPVAKPWSSVALLSLPVLTAYWLKFFPCLLQAKNSSSWFFARKTPSQTPLKVLKAKRLEIFLKTGYQYLNTYLITHLYSTLLPSWFSRS